MSAVNEFGLSLPLHSSSLLPAAESGAEAHRFFGQLNFAVQSSDSNGADFIWQLPAGLADTIKQLEVQLRKESGWTPAGRSAPVLGSNRTHVDFGANANADRSYPMRVRLLDSAGSVLESVELPRRLLSAHGAPTRSPRAPLSFEASPAAVGSGPESPDAGRVTFKWQCSPASIDDEGIEGFEVELYEKEKGAWRRVGRVPASERELALNLSDHFTSGERIRARVRAHNAKGAGEPLELVAPILFRKDESRRPVWPTGSLVAEQVAEGSARLTWPSAQSVAGQPITCYLVELWSADRQRWQYCKRVSPYSSTSTSSQVYKKI